MRESILRSNRRDSKVFSKSLQAPLTPAAPCSRLAFVGGVWIGIVVTICQTDSWMHRAAAAARANTERLAVHRRLISPKIHTAIPDNGVENFITPARARDTAQSLKDRAAQVRLESRI